MNTRFVKGGKASMPSAEHAVGHGTIAGGAGYHSIDELVEQLPVERRGQVRKELLEAISSPALSKPKIQLDDLFESFPDAPPGD
jgi:hypothetical protein